MPEHDEEVAVPLADVIGGSTRGEIQDLIDEPGYLAIPSREALRTAPPNVTKLIRVDKLLAKAGLAESVSDGARKAKQGAVQVNGQASPLHLLLLLTMPEVTIR